MDEVLKKRMEQQFMLDFNYNSNHLEGNALTYGQTELLLIFGQTPFYGANVSLEQIKPFVGYISNIIVNAD